MNKLPFETFQLNVDRASALVRFDGYLEDIVSGRAKQLLGSLAEMPNKMMKIIGMDAILMEEVNEMARRLKVRAEPILAKLDQAAVKKKVEDAILPDLERLVRIFKDLGLVTGRTLPEQALVIGVSAFEVYLKDVTANMVANSSRIEKRFSQEIKAGFNLSKLEAYKNNVRRTKGEIASDSVALDPNGIRRVLRKLTGWDEIFATKDDEKKFVRIVATRNLIIHKAGLVDSRFKRLTGYSGPTGRLLIVNRTYSLESLDFMSSLVGIIDRELRNSG